MVKLCYKLILFKLQDHKINRFDICRKLGDLFSHMIFVKGFLHSDPHPGNILVRKDPEDKEVTVYLLDHGLYAVSYFASYFELFDGQNYQIKLHTQKWVGEINRVVCICRRR